MFVCLNMLGVDGVCFRWKRRLTGHADLDSISVVATAVVDVAVGHGQLTAERGTAFI